MSLTPSAEQAIVEYYFQHQRCRKCGCACTWDCDPSLITKIGIAIVEDLNVARCTVCPWTGIVHSLTVQPPLTDSQILGIAKWALL